MYNFEEMIHRIKVLKKEQKLSNEALSILSGIPKGTLAKILGSETRDPQISNVIKISQALGVSADYIIFGKEDPRYDDDFLNLFSLLNFDGQNKVIEYIRDLINSGNYRSLGITSNQTSLTDVSKEPDKSQSTNRIIYRAARSTDHAEPRFEKRSVADLEKLERATPVTSDDDI